MRRRAGVLLAISSIPSPYGIGGFTKEAYEFVDFLKEAGQSLWQILPLGPTGYGDSPYQSFSTFAGNPYYIDLKEFIDKGWLSKKDCEKYKVSHPEYVDYEAIYNSRFALLKKAYDKSGIAGDPDFKKFVKDNEYWLEGYALYMAIKDSKKGISWLEWEDDIKLRKPAAVKKYREKLKDDYIFYQFQQYFFYKQWYALKGYANEKGIEIIGDIPIYVALDSADTWCNPELFKLDKNCNPTHVAGCPPDVFTADGQLWGNPLYRWDYHKKTGYEWWIKRLAACYKLYDIVRIDHFRGFDEYYSIEYGRKNAIIGEWLPGPGYELFEVLKNKLGNKQVIAEDLGFMTDSVRRLVKKTKYPNMKIIMFAFDIEGDSEHMPHNYEHNCVVYTGTHDNDTLVHWYQTLKRQEKAFVKDYLGIKKGAKVTEVADGIIRAAYASVADTAIIPMQDVLSLGGETRMNVPSTLGTNWKWRLRKDSLTPELAVKMRRQATVYKRI